MTFYRGCWGVLLGLASLFFRLRVEGQRHIPTDGGVILASNHCSYVDPVLIGLAAERELWYVTKQDVFPVPVLGWLIRKVHAMPMDRSRGDREALALMEGRLRSGAAVLIFPEGTRNKTGRLLRPKAGVGMMVHRASVPVVPACILGTVNVWKCLIGLRRPVVRFGEPIHFSPDRLPSRRRDAYHSISSEVMRKIGDLRRSARKADTPVGVSTTPS